MSSKLLHAHGCRQCRARYVDACTTRDEDHLCIECRGGIPWRLLIANAAPRPCCVTHGRLATKDEKKTYALAGRSNWFICPTCKRTHPTRPALKETTS